MVTILCRRSRTKWGTTRFISPQYFQLLITLSLWTTCIEYLFRKNKLWNYRPRCSMELTQKPRNSKYINQALGLESVIFIHPTLVFQSRKLFLFCFYNKIGLHLIECIMKITAVFKHMAEAIRHGRIILFLLNHGCLTNFIHDCPCPYYEPNCVLFYPS